MKVELGQKNYLYPALVVLVGANVNGKPNYTPVAHTGLWITRSSVALTANSHSNKGIKENGTFSFNMPSQEQLILTDYCGLVSGKDTDKGALFTTFYGELGTAPMIEECPLNMEFRVVETTVSPRTRGPPADVYIGEIIATYCNEDVLTDDKFDLMKAKPYFVSARDLFYYGLGERIARDGDGKELKEKLEK
jgi:flavin reductase (DIM6/NTAB) family NADH-FMN oxidoreductase RutF